MASLFVFASAPVEQARAALANDYRAVSPTPVSLPPAGGSFFDVDFGERTKIIRVTKAAGAGLSPPSLAGTQRCFTSDASLPAFNLDSSYVYVVCENASGYLYSFDKVADRPTFQSDLAGGVPGFRFNAESAFWSGISPNLLYVIGRDGGQSRQKSLYRIDVSRHDAGRVTLIHDFTADLDAWSNRYGFPSDVDLWQLGKSSDDDVFTFTTRDPSGVNKFNAVAYQRSLDRATPYTDPMSIDESAVDELGRWVIIVGRGQNAGEWRFWDFRSGTTSLFADLQYDSTDRTGGHYAAGATLLVSSETGWDTPDSRSGAQVRFYGALSAPRDIVRYLMPDRTTETYIADHFSAGGADESTVVGSTYGCVVQGNACLPSFRAPFDSEIYLARTNGGGFLRLAHTRATLNAVSDPQSQPKATLDRSGRYIAFTSDMGQTTSDGAPVVDVWILKVPPSPQHPYVGSANRASVAGTNFFLSSGNVWRKASGTSRNDGNGFGSPLVGGLARLSSTYYRYDGVWAISENGHLLDHYRDAFGIWRFRDHGLPPAPCNFAVGNPSAASSSNEGVGSHLGVVVACAGGGLMERRFVGAWTWRDLGRPSAPGVTVAGNPSYVASHTTGFVAAFLTGSDGHLWEVQAGNSGPAWSDHGLPAADALLDNGGPGAVVANTGAQETVLVADSNGEVWERYSLSNGGFAWRSHGAPSGCPQTTGLGGVPSIVGAGGDFMGTAAGSAIYEFARCTSDATAVRRILAGTWSWGPSFVAPGGRAMSFPHAGEDGTAPNLDVQDVAGGNYESRLVNGVWQTNN